MTCHAALFHAIPSNAMALTALVNAKLLHATPFFSKTVQYNCKLGSLQFSILYCTTLHYTILHCTMLFVRNLSFAMLCYANLRYPFLCHALLCMLTDRMPG